MARGVALPSKIRPDTSCANSNCRNVPIVVRARVETVHTRLLIKNDEKTVATQFNRPLAQFAELAAINSSTRMRYSIVANLFMMSARQ